MPFFFKTDKATSSRLMPFKEPSVKKRWLDVIGTSVGNRSVTVCPSVFANLWPSPVEPVCGTLLPPVVIMTLRALNVSPSLVFTPVILSPSVNTAATSVSKRMSTLFCSSCSKNTFSTSFALFETGNIRPWSSSFNFTPLDSTKLIIDSLSKTENGPYRNFPLPGICLIISS